MKKIRILFLMAVFLTCLVGSAFSEEYQPTDKTSFQASQSYELSDLILLFSKYKTSDSTIISKGIYHDNPLQYLYNLNKSELGQPSLNINDYFGGQIGLLINGNGYTAQKQAWNDGILQNNFIKMGYTTSAIFLCPVYWGFNALELNLSTSPVYIKKHLGVSKPNEYLDFTNYFREKNFSATIIHSNGYLGTGKAFWEITTPHNTNVYLIVWQSCGASGLIGSTKFVIFYEKTKALEAYKTFNPK